MQTLVEQHSLFEGTFIIPSNAVRRGWVRVEEYPQGRARPVGYGGCVGIICLEELRHRHALVLRVVCHLGSGYPGCLSSVTEERCLLQVRHKIAPRHLQRPKDVRLARRAIVSVTQESLEARIGLGGCLGGAGRERWALLNRRPPQHLN